MKYDVTIKSHPKDYHKINLVLDSLIFLNPQPENIYIITPDGWLPNNKKYSKKLFSVKDSEVIIDINRDKLNYRKNWAWQNLFSIFQDITKNDLYLDIQADNFFVDNVDLFGLNGKPNIFRSKENEVNNLGHKQYFTFNKNVFNLEKKWTGYSYIIEFMLYDRKILKDFFNKNFESMDDLLEKIYMNTNKFSYLADQEFYGNLIENEYKNYYNFIDNTPIKFEGSSDDIKINLIKKYSKKSKEINPEIIAFSYHTWKSTELEINGMNEYSKIFVAGHNGLVGSAIVRKLKEQGYKNIITMSKSELDLRDQKMVEWFFSVYEPEYVFLAAAKVGGIGYNKAAPADFIYDNLQIQNNVIHNANKYNVTKLLFLGSACIYPKITPQPIKEEYLLSDYLEPTNEGYALAKIAGLKMCNYYREQYGLNAISLMPANLYGVNDNFNIEQCHVIPAMINKFLRAKETGEPVTLFGDGSPTREFLYVDDLAEACIFLMNTYNSPEHINIGSSEEYTILELANLIADKVNFTGDIIWDTEKPNGTPKRKLDISKLESLGWKSSIALDEGLERTVGWYLETGGKRNA